MVLNQKFNQLLIRFANAVLPTILDMIGALLRYVCDSRRKDRQPMNAAFGLLPPLPGKKQGKKLRYAAYSERALTDMRRWAEAVSPR